MALSTFESLWRGILLRAPLVSPFLAREWINYRFRLLQERRRWSWLVKSGQWLVNDVYNTGTVDVVRGSQIVTGHSTAWTSDLAGRQFRLNATYPIYTILSVNVAGQTLTLDDVFGATTQSGVGYQIYNAYMFAPVNFHSWVSVWDPAYNWQLWTQIAQEELNSWDAQRANQGTAWVVAQLDYCDQSFYNPPIPRYELWPHQMSAKPYPFLYECRYGDLTDSGVSLPRYIPGNVLLEGALADCARWPGPNKDEPNPYFNLGLAMQHEANWEREVNRLETQDDEVYELNVRYSSVLGLPFAVIPFMDSRFLQSHAPL